MTAVAGLLADSRKKYQIWFMRIPNLSDSESWALPVVVCAANYPVICDTHTPPVVVLS